MRRWSALEQTIVLVGGLFVLCGSYNIIRPSPMTIPHQSYRFAPSWVEVAGKGRVRFYGILAMTTGGGLIWLAGYRGKRSK